MSLLLDALKKAAEQKAEKDAEANPEGAVSAEARVHDETQSDFGQHKELPSDQVEVDSLAVEQANNASITIDSEEVTDLGEETIQNIFDEDQTMVLTDDDVTSFMGDGDFSPGEAGKEELDVDLSLVLIDEEATTGLSYEGPEPGSLAAQTEVQLLADNEDTTNQLNLAGDSEQQQADDQNRTVTLTPDHTPITGVNLDGLTTQEPGFQDHTSTRTYAPDNYDRTLARVSNDDASELFAGMKSDSDLVMTPEHAKKVFVSKFSAQRMYRYRIFSAAAFGILLVIGILGMFEFQQQSFTIDTNLRPLKRDPMPGVIKLASNQEPSTNLPGEATQPTVDIQTLRLIEDAKITGEAEIAVSEAVEIAQIPEPDTQPGLTGAQSSKGVNIESGLLPAQPVVAQVEPVNKVNTNTSVKGLDEAPKQQLQISTSSKISDKDRWLSEAYAAYQRGDDKTALAKYNQVIEVDPGNRNALLARAAINIQDNNVAAAIRDYRRLLLANPKDSFAMASLMAVTNYSPQVAESQLKIMIHEEPNSPYLNFALANVYGAQDRWIEAQGLYFTALENNPNDPNYAYNLAVSLEHIEKPEVAIAYYERALDNFNNGLAMFNRNVVDQRLEKLKQL